MIAPYCEEGKECTGWLYWPIVILFGVYKAISMGTLYPSVSMVVEKDMLPVAFGIVTALSNILTFILSLIGA